jgi:anti-anti-sigma regulatory factor
MVGELCEELSLDESASWRARELLRPLHELLTPHCFDALRQVVAELVGQCAKEASTGQCAEEASTGMGVRLTVHMLGEVVEVEVRRPRQVQVAQTDASGHDTARIAFQVVDTLAQKWGVREDEQAVAVWVRIPNHRQAADNAPASHPPTSETILVHREDEMTILELLGEHDLVDLDVLSAHLEAALANGLPITVDLSRTLLLDSAVIGELLHAAERARHGGTPFVLFAPPDSFARQVFAALNISSNVAITPTLEAARLHSDARGTT